MRGSFVASAAAMCAGANAHAHGRLHQHLARGVEKAADPVALEPCAPVCTTIWQYEWEGKTITVAPPASTSTASVKQPVIVTIPVIPVAVTTPPVSTGTFAPTQEVYGAPSSTINFAPVATPSSPTGTDEPDCQDEYKKCIADGTSEVACQCTLASCSGEDNARTREHCASATGSAVPTATPVVPETPTTPGTDEPDCQDEYKKCIADGTSEVACQCTLASCSGEDNARTREHCATATGPAVPAATPLTPNTPSTPEAIPSTPYSTNAPAAPVDKSTDKPADKPDEPVPATPVPTASVPPTVEEPVKTPQQPEAPATVPKAPIDKASTTPVTSDNHSPKSNSPKTADGLTTKGNQWAMTYTPYANDGGCKTKDQVAIDISVIAKKGFATIRLYGTDCSTLEFVGEAAATHGLKLILGIFIDTKGLDGAAQSVKTMSEFKQWALVELVVIGNEAIFNNFVTAQALSIFISSTRANFKLLGYNGMITTSETLGVWQNPTTAQYLCPVTDITGVNMHPFFNGEVSAEKAGDFAFEQQKIAETICPGHAARNLEIGWPNQGIKCNGKACAGKEEQKKAILSILEKTGSKSVIFSFENDMWKRPGEHGVEQYWGCVDLF